MIKLTYNITVSPQPPKAKKNGGTQAAIDLCFKNLYVFSFERSSPFDNNYLKYHNNDNILPFNYFSTVPHYIIVYLMVQDEVFLLVVFNHSILQKTSTNH